MNKEVKGSFVILDDEEFYKIENYDCMEDFFMTLTSSSDVWNFLWAKGGITAGRKNSNFAIFQYGTADKISDYKYSSGSYTAIAVFEESEVKFWQPFSKFYFSDFSGFIDNEKLHYNIYKNLNGSKIWFEEINDELQLTFRYGWTSSRKYGVVKSCKITNTGSAQRKLYVLDGVRNVLASHISADMQASKSILLNAYKKTDLDLENQLAIFSLSSAVSDKAEPLEALTGNVCWFTTDDRVFIDDGIIKSFFNQCAEKKFDFSQTEVLKGQRPSCFIIHNSEIGAGKSDEWKCVLDVSLDAVQISELKKTIGNKKNAEKLLAADIEQTEKLLETFLQETDGIQKSGDKMTAVHHRTNVMFNIMRGGFFADNGKIYYSDLLSFVKTRNVKAYETLKKAFEKLPQDYSSFFKEFYVNVAKLKEPQLCRLMLEYLPVIFSRRHGDPSRPWNQFNIALTDKNGNQILNYEGNWRDIFQNWEALLYSYPEYTQNIVAKFVNAMTMDGFNPYRISRNGIDWECPDPDDPWAQYGYWGDHQIIYLQKLLELLKAYDSETLKDFLGTKLFSSSNVPYRLRSYKEICENPRDSLIFEEKLSNALIAAAAEKGTDQKLVLDKNGNVELLTLTAKLLQIIIAKMANFVPEGGIWMNTQRPEWNDANNALCGWGLSVVTSCYLERMLKFLIGLYGENKNEGFEVPVAMAECIEKLTELFAGYAGGSDSVKRKNFCDSAQHIFEAERNDFYKNYYGSGFKNLPASEVLKFLEACEKLVSAAITANRRDDGLYHTYNTLAICGNEMHIEHLQPMLEGQVAVLSSKQLSYVEVINVCEALKDSAMYEKRQNSYMLYPNKELPVFWNKNCISSAEAELPENADILQFLEKDAAGNYHFAKECQNQRILEERISGCNISSAQKEKLFALYEKTFNHHAFTGRSGTFYAYEGLGSIYWHMVSKLMLAVQENAIEAFRNDDKNGIKLFELYRQIKNGLGAAKTPELYGAFPYDPYSHTPFGKGAQQPGMTGQVKEEIITRFGELGLFIENGCAVFNPKMISRSEFNEKGELSFTWCGVPVIYRLVEKESDEKSVVHFCDNSEVEQSDEILSKEVSEKLFCRSGKIKKIEVFKNISFLN